MRLTVPPGGFAGFAQQTPAAQRALSDTAAARRNPRAARRTARINQRFRKRKAKQAKRAAKKGRKLKFGSPAWRKKYMRK